MKALITAVAATALLAGQAHAMEWKDLAKGPDLFVGLGFGGFTGDLGSVTGAGVNWDVRAGVNPSPYWGAELNYQGLNTGVSALISNGVLVSGQSMTQQQISVDGRAGYPFRVADRELKPYGFFGLGYAHISSNSFLTSAGLESDNAFVMPIGAGVTYALSDVFRLDGRFTYNIMTGSRSTLAPTGDAWNAGISVGAQLPPGR